MFSSGRQVDGDAVAGELEHGLVLAGDAVAGELEHRLVLAGDAVAGELEHRQVPLSADASTSDRITPQVAGERRRPATSAPATMPARSAAFQRTGNDTSSTQHGSGDQIAGGRAVAPFWSTIRTTPPSTRPISPQKLLRAAT